MTVHLPIIDFSPDQRELWQRVMDLWALSQSRDESKICSTLHPDYVGWDMSTPLPHGREFAVHSVSGDSPEVREYALKPLSVQVYEEQIGVWLMISISGRPDVQGTGDGVAGRIGSNDRPLARSCSKHHN